MRDAGLMAGAPKVSAARSMSCGTGASPHALDNALADQPGARGDDVDLAADDQGNAMRAIALVLLVELAVVIALVVLHLAVR
jgi:hypothetical protein